MPPQNIPVESRPKKMVGLAIGVPMWHAGKSVSYQYVSDAQDNRVGVGADELLSLRKFTSMPQAAGGTFEETRCSIRRHGVWVYA
ncbi:hypothetical protein BRAO375_1990003 [Bradyrhizobium sp. ORS 375]|nr:hypothetical protein BRAO375_1990003 [Bradyrhizobium sp. ORS 375]